MDKEVLDTARSWAFEQARKVLTRIGGKTPDKGYVLFETGYGPSGLPHIGTFGEVCRTSMVVHAFNTLTGNRIPTKLLCVSDDMDGMRKIPDNVPDKAILEPHLHKPLTVVPNPFGGDYESFGHHNNAMLRRFLNTFGFDYEFASATDYYRNGTFDPFLLRALEKYDDIMGVMLPTLGEERQATYSPFLPISPTTGRVLYVPMKSVDAGAGTITFDDEDGSEVTLPVTGGNVKLQWKPDFGMRWAALDVDFEMFGKDHGPNAPLYDRICEILGGKAPEHYIYELFLDEKGEKISKSKGNGLSMEDWLRYAPHESLGLYMYQKPRTAKRLYFDVIPKAVDEYIEQAAALPGQSDEDKLNNPVWYVHNGQAPNGAHSPVSYALLLNLASAANAADKATLWGFINRYAPAATPENAPFLDRMCDYAVNYYQDFVKPAKQYRKADAREEAALRDLSRRIAALPTGSDFDTLQTEVFSAGKENGFEKKELRQWFQAIYEVLLGQSQGPRFGSFIELYGVEETITLIDQALNGDFVAMNPVDETLLKFKPRAADGSERMAFTIDPAIFNTFPDARFGVMVVTGLKNGPSSEAVQDLLAVQCAETAASLGDTPITEHSMIAPWREAYKTFGAKPKKYPSSIEALYRRVGKGDILPSINTLVDLYNIISIRYGLPLGGEDLDAMQGDLRLTFAGDDETPVTVLGENEAKAPEPGEVIYKDDIGTICRRWNWREVERTTLKDGTSNAILVLETLDPNGMEILVQALTDLEALVRDHGGDGVGITTSLLTPEDITLPIAA